MSRIGRPRAATVIAFVALVAALSGTAYAAKTMITSKNIVDGTIKGKDVKDDALKGKHVKESTLGKVPNAAQADSATSANTIGGSSAADLEERWVLVGADGTIAAQSGGFSLVDCYDANANCYIDAGEDVTDNAISAEIATANNPDAGTDTQLTGDTSAAPCFLDFVNCGPMGTDSGNGGTNGVFVVVPRNSDGTDPGAGDRYPFYAFISDSEAAATP